MNLRNSIVSLSLFTIFATGVLFAADPIAGNSRVWVSRDGQFLRAVLVRVEDGTAVLKTPNGRLREVLLSELSNEDKTFAQNFSAASPAAEIPAPRSILKSRDDVELIPPPRPEPDSNVATSATDPPESASTPAEPKKLPKAIRTLQRLLNANAESENEHGASPLFGPDSSVYIALSAKFLNEFIQVPIDHKRRVEETIMGLSVAGTAVTRGFATLALVPSPDHAAFEIVVSGRAESITSGQQLILNVDSDGTTQFEARKRIEISSDGFDLFEATATAQTTVNRSAVSTQLPGRIGLLVGRIAREVVAANRRQIDYEASERAAYRAAVDLDLRVDSEVERVQQVLGEIAPGLAAGKPIIPIRFRTSSDMVAILIGEYEPPEWQSFGKQVARDGQDITVVLPKRTVSTAKQLQMAMKLLSISLEDQFNGVKPEELTPTSQNWSNDKEWLTLVWDVDATIVELLSKDFLTATQVDPPEQPANREEPPRYNPDVPRWNQGGRRQNVFRPLP